MADPELLAHWLNATARGDRAAFRALYENTSSHLLGLLLRMLRRRDLAEEALQDCYVRIWRNAGTYAPERGAPMAWLVGIARNRALDLLRRNRPEVSLDDDPEDDGSNDQPDDVERGPAAEA